MTGRNEKHVGTTTLGQALIHAGIPGREDAWNGKGQIKVNGEWIRADPTFIVRVGAVYVFRDGAGNETSFASISNTKQPADAYEYARHTALAQPRRSLVNAAADLLEVCEDLLPDLKCKCDVGFTSRGRHEPNSLCHHYDRVLRAVKKAKGE